MHLATYLNNVAVTLNQVITAADIAANKLTFTPTTNFNGSANFNYTVSDGSLSSNVATVTINVAPVSTDVAQIAPTGATINQYINGTAQDFDQFYASQGGVIQYGTKVNKINSTNPGVFFYFTGLSNTIKGFDGPDAGTAPDLMSIKIDQSNNKLNVSGIANSTNTDTAWNFGTALNDIKLYKVTDANNNGKIDAGETATQIQLQSSQVVFGTGADKGDVTINFTPDAIGSLYVASVK